MFNQERKSCLEDKNKLENWRELWKFWLWLVRCKSQGWIPLRHITCNQHESGDDEVVACSHAFNCGVNALACHGPAVIPLQSIAYRIAVNIYHETMNSSASLFLIKKDSENKNNWLSINSEKKILFELKNLKKK